MHFLHDDAPKLFKEYSRLVVYTKGQAWKERRSITLELFVTTYRTQRGRCFYLDIPLGLEPGNFRVSIERLDNSKKYEAGNIALVCLEANVWVGTKTTSQEIKWTKELADILWPRS